MAACIVLSLLLSPTTLRAVTGTGDSESETVAGVEQQQTKRTITGTVVTGDTNEPAVGATVYLRNSTTGTITDTDGKFSITVEGLGGVLDFSYIGYKSQEVALVGQTSINVTLQPDNEVLDEVVVVGYGSQRKESVVGAISTLDVTKLIVPTSNLSTALAGQLSGIVAMSRSGEPGKNSAADFYIRGVSSFTGNTSPLVLVDGVERDLDLVDTEDIASFSILKDASASAVYGVRGANGVILITTKKGAVGKPQVNVRTEFGFTQPTKKPKMVNSAQWAELYNEAYSTNYYSAEDIEMYRSGADPDLYPNVDWFDTMFNNMAANQRVNLNITGGSDIVRYYVAGSFYNESSIYKNAGNIYGYDSSIRYNKFNFRANVDLNLTKSTVINLNLANIYEKSFGPGFGDTDSDIWSYLFMTSPNAFPVEYSDGRLSGPSTDSGYNPWNMLVHSGYREQFWNSAQSLIGVTQDIGALWEPLKGLTANIKFSWDAWNTTLQRRSKSPTFYHARGRAEDGSLIYDDENGDGIWEPVHTGDETLSYGIGRSGTMTRYVEGSLTYNRLFGEHRVGALFLYNHKIYTDTQAGSSSASLPYKDQGIAGRLTYAFRDTYFLEVNMGYNGSENFARGHRFGFFPAVALGWMMSSEKWFEPATKVIDMLKWKASYGKVGNDDIGGTRRWVYEPTIVTGGSWSYGQSGNQGGSGIRVGEVENLEASWEEALKLNAGVEFSLFNKVRVQADYFREKRQGIFLKRAGLPAIVGVSTVPYVNIGETLNQGFDATVEYMHKVNDDLFITARGNFTFNRNKLINNDEPDWEYRYQNRIGKPFGSGGSTQPFGLIALGLFESEEEIANSPVQNFGEYRVGDIKYQDVNGDGIVDEQDAVAIGYTNLPEITYGFGATAQWKGWDFNLFFQGVARTSFFLSGSSIRSPFSTGNMERAAINEDVYGNVWMSTNTAEQNAGVTYPRLSAGSGGAGSTNNNRASTWWLRDGSFLRLKSMEIGYSLPQHILQKSFIKSLRFYISGNNLLCFSPFKLWDPEKGTSDGSGYPLNRTFSIGFNANF
ncbi:SusC/RagA family TonB-linked outer membrane protein [Bacteroides gallinaceum]|uniref:TonB-dependent receptor n=1 Tax=Bacteroides gallinaceum TaxID=1462571 RepID=A0ABT7VJ75_9BACE|nr:TonB-dependent receptor [Bacteroides gallinaceum]MDM8325663.1 TonB-dependent receptor [Bacteroides gallinaceum]